MWGSSPSKLYGGGLGLLVVVTQPYVPAYRVPLFDALDEVLRTHGAKLLVVAANPERHQALRGDATTANRWAARARSVRLTIFGRVVLLRSSPKAPTADVLVTELTAYNVTAWWALLRRSLKGKSFSQRLVLWGQALSYVDEATRVGTLLKRQLALRVDAVMTYSERGRQHLLCQGVPAESVVTIGNATDTSALRPNLSMELQSRGLSYESRPGCALFVGGLDESKRIDFLVEAAEAAHALDGSFRLTIVGRGPLVNLLEPGLRAGYIEHVPVARGANLARLAAGADRVWMPGRVGLVAVDALALGMPVMTVKHDRHAPEVDLLIEGRSRFTLPDNPSEFARASASLTGPFELTPDEDVPNVQGVASRMAEVILRGPTAQEPSSPLS